MSIGNQTLRACAVAFAFTLTLVTAHAAGAKVKAPEVPAALAVPAGHVAYFQGHAIGTQNYICLPSGAGWAWALFNPQATLFRKNGKQNATHFSGPNPSENGTVRPAWLSSRDSSTVWGKLHASSTDANYVAPGAIPWLLVDAAGSEEGPEGGKSFTRTTYIHRVNTSGGAAPASGCAAAADVGKRAYEPYSADYYFYRDEDCDDDQDD